MTNDRPNNIIWEIIYWGSIRRPLVEYPVQYRNICEIKENCVRTARSNAPLSPPLYTPLSLSPPRSFPFSYVNLISFINYLFDYIKNNKLKKKDEKRRTRRAEKGTPTIFNGFCTVNVVGFGQNKFGWVINNFPFANPSHFMKFFIMYFLFVFF